MKVLARGSAVFLGLCLVFCAASRNALAASVPAAVPDGTALALGDSCYTMTTQQNGTERVIGYVFQSIQRQTVNGVDALAIVVHQHLANGKFDMRDSFLVRRQDLRPIQLDTDRDGSPHVHLEYTANRITGWKTVNGAKTAIEVALDEPVWDGNLWGITFAALPLKKGGAYRIPTYQYDNGKGVFLVSVKEERKIATPAGEVDAWVLEAGAKSDELVEYLIGKNPLRELGYLAGPMSQKIGGDCGSLH